MKEEKIGNILGQIPLLHQMAAIYLSIYAGAPENQVMVINSIKYVSRFYSGRRSCLRVAV